jgi:hypothetical protein
MHVYQPTPTTLIAQGRHRLPQRGAALLILAIGTLSFACISLGVSILTFRSHNPPLGALNDAMATLAFFLKGASLTN